MSHYERLAGLSPANKTAAIVTTANGEAWDDHMKFGQIHVDTPLRITPRPSWAEDLVGRKFGRLTVLGFYSGSLFNGSVWVVRCVCGAYETRRRETIIKAHSDACCKACGRLRVIQLRGSSMKRMKKAVSVSS